MEERVFLGEVDQILVFGFSDFIGMVQLLYAISAVFVTGKELLGEKKDCKLSNK